MSNTEKIYWLTRVDPFISMLIALLTISGMAMALYWTILFVNSDFQDDEEIAEYKKKYGCKARIATWLIVVVGILLLFIPSKSDIILIVAGGKTMDFVENDPNLKNIPAKTTEIIIQHLDNTISEMNKNPSEN